MAPHGYEMRNEPTALESFIGAIVGGYIGSITNVTYSERSRNEQLKQTILYKQTLCTEYVRTRQENEKS